ncbi:uncharacterized protein [Palaemon carinicauda]|uniref:uncharacterized protein n=1 Tax=Palaemon carinicauda TaxID=392227 RepID=UPI0035B59060
MFSMRRNFRKPIGLVLLFVFLWICVTQDDGYYEENRETPKPPRDSGQKIETSPQDDHRRKLVEDVIFGQGILMTRSRGTVSRDQSELVRKSDNGGVSGIEKTSGASFLGNEESGKNEIELREKRPKAAVGTVKVQDNNDQEIKDEKYPVRYKNAIDESKLRESGNLSPGGDGGSSSVVSFIKGHDHRHSPAWMRITDDIYTYSAFWDDREQLDEGPVARILGILRLKSELLHEENKFQFRGTVRAELLNCTCLLWYRGTRDAQPGILKAHIFDEGRKMFGGTFFLCYPQRVNSTDKVEGDSRYVESRGTNLKGGGSSPYAVSLHPHNAVDAPHKLIYLHRKSVKFYHPSEANSSAVCVRSLFGPYDDVSAMAQFVSYYNSILNVSHFYFYDLAVAPQVNELLEAYRELGLAIEMFPWNLPTSEWGELWDMGSLVALNDCVYRSSGKHALVAIVDLDEFIVPKKAFHGLGDLYRNVINFRSGSHGDAVLFSNVFFCFDFKKSDGRKKEIFPIFEYTQRESRPWPPKSRSKMLVVPEASVSVGHHMVHGFVSKNLTNRSSSKLFALLHHYRTCKDIRLGMHGTGSEVLSNTAVKDLSMQGYKKVVLNSKTMKIFRQNFT